MIDSIEVLTGGASRHTGGCRRGVVNFKLNDHFEGVKIVADAGIYNHSNANTDGVEDAIAAMVSKRHLDCHQGAQKSIAFIAGLNSEDGKGNATFYATIATWRRCCKAILVQRVYAEFRLYDLELGQVLLRGSSTTFPGRFATIGAGAPASTTPLDPMERWCRTRPRTRTTTAPLTSSSARMSATRPAPSCTMTSMITRSLCQHDVHGR